MSSSMIGGIILGGLAIVGVLILFGMMLIVGVRHDRRKRELEHTERMKALELGRTLPGDEAWWTPARVCAAIGAGVPVGAFGCALIATFSGMAQHGDGAWVAASVVGTSAVICGAILATRLPIANKGARESAQDVDAKPAFHPDDYDVVGRHG